MQQRGTGFSEPLADVMLSALAVTVKSEVVTCYTKLPSKILENNFCWVTVTKHRF